MIDSFVKELCPRCGGTFSCPRCRGTCQLMGKKPIRLLARNIPLELICSECDEPAEVVCPLCMDLEPYLFCSEHAEKHKCADE
jgi:hypothetical protein